MDVKKIRKDFPILKRMIDNKPIIYFDNACMTLKPKQVIESMNDYYYKYSACVGRSIHKLGSEATIKFEEARNKIRKYINAKKTKEIIFTKNTTESINLISRSFKLEKDDIVITTDKEHNSNLIPWHLQKKLRHIKHKVVESNKDNTFNLEKFENSMNKKVKLVSMVHMSNMDGYTIPAEEIIKIAHDYNAYVLLDGAQSASHLSIDVQKLDVDIFTFSIHKMLGPTGIGVLYGKQDILNKLEPFIVGGNTVGTSSYDSSTFLDIPEKFEAGLQNYAGVIGAGTAVDYITNIGRNQIKKHEYELNRYITENIRDISNIKIIGPDNPKQRGSIICFNIKDKEPHDVTIELDKSNINVRSGVFCCHSWFKHHKIKGAIRVSIFLYNTKKECDTFIEKIKDIA